MLVTLYSLPSLLDQPLNKPSWKPSSSSPFHIQEAVHQVLGGFVCFLFCLVFFIKSCLIYLRNISSLPSPPFPLSFDHSSPFYLVPLPPFIPLFLSLAHCPQILFIGIDFYLSLAFNFNIFCIAHLLLLDLHIFNIFITHTIPLAPHSI